MSLLEDSMAVGGQSAVGLGRGAGGQRQMSGKGHPWAEERGVAVCAPWVLSGVAAKA